MKFQEVLDHQRASTALHRLAPKLRRLYFLPKKNLHNICAFQRIMKKWCDVYGDLPDIDTFSYTFPCDFAKKHNEVKRMNTQNHILSRYIRSYCRSIYTEQVEWSLKI